VRAKFLFCQKRSFAGLAELDLHKVRISKKRGKIISKAKDSREKFRDLKTKV
jgi:hypothetical protein